MEIKKHNGGWYHNQEFSADGLSEDGKQLAGEAGAYLRGRALKDRLAAKAMNAFKIHGTGLIAAATFGLSRCMYPASAKRSSRQTQSSAPSLPHRPLDFI